MCGEGEAWVGRGREGRERREEGEACGEKGREDSGERVHGGTQGEGLTGRRSEDEKAKMGRTYSFRIPRRPERVMAGAFVGREGPS